MTLSVAQLAANEADLALPIAGDTLNIKYYPGKLTAKVTDQFTTMDGLCKSLGGIIKSWDLLGEDGLTAYPLDAESLAGLGIGLLREVAMGIVTDTRPN